MFENPDEIHSQFRRLLLGVDTNGGAAGPLRGLPRWFLDLSISKDIMLGERMGLSFNAQFVNVLNHFQPGDPAMNQATQR
jgi:hypothetical protein